MRPGVALLMLSINYKLAKGLMPKEDLR